MNTISNDPVLHSPINLVFKRIGEFYAVLHADQPNIMVVDKSGKEFFKLCDGRHKLSEIADHMRLRYPSEETSIEKITEFSSALLNAGFVYTRPPPILKKKVGLSEELRQIYLHLTHRCNLRCKHCYINAGIPLQHEVTPKEVLRLIEEFKNLGGNRLIITGGEPFLRRKLLYETVKKARKLEVQDINVETNGTLIDGQDVHFLRDSGVKVAVSLGGATGKSHSYVRGKETFQKVIRCIKNLVESNVDTTIGMTFMRPNLKEGRAIIQLAQRLGVDLVTLNMITMMGRAKEHNELAISPLEVMPAIKELRQAARETGTRTAFEETLSTLKNMERREACGAGVSSLSIAANGDVYPCNSFQGGPLKAGNMRQQSLESIWKESDVCRTFQDLSVLDIPGCRECELKFMCSGGCLAETFREYRDLKTKSPYCSVYKEIYWNLITELACELWKNA